MFDQERRKEENKCPWLNDSKDGVFCEDCEYGCEKRCEIVVETPILKTSANVQSVLLQNLLLVDLNLNEKVG